jgi:hypothetical protein
VIESAPANFEKTSMNGWITYGIAVLFLLCLSSCSIFGKKSNGDDCVGGACDQAIGDNKSQIPRSWYCYGVQQDRSWDCSKEPRPEMITTVVPFENRPVTPPTPLEVLLQQAPLTMLQVTGPNEINTLKAPTGSVEMGSAAGSEEVLSLPGDYFTVQLMAMKNEQKVLAYATENGIENPLYVRILSQDINWYVLLLGTYADQSAANDAKSDWEETRVLEVKPWTRRLSPLQDAIRLALDR